MLGLEGWMDIRSLHQQGLSISAIARREGVDRKTVRKYLRDSPHEYRRGPQVQKIDAYRSYLRERWEQGVENAYRLFREIRQRGYSGGITRVAQVVQGWRSEGHERAFVRFETAPGQQAQMDWGHFGNWDGKRLYGFALTLAWSRMQYVEFTQRQDMETMLNCMVHAFSYFGGVTAAILTDNMKTCTSTTTRYLWEPSTGLSLQPTNFMTRMVQRFRRTYGKQCTSMKAQIC